MVKGRDFRYWDSNAFLGYLKGEEDKYDDCESVLEAADQGRIIIVTSALTLAEVLYTRKLILPEADKIKIDNFFKSVFISVRNVTRKIAEDARNVVWQYKVRPKDAVHIATALQHRIPVFNTFDNALLRKDGQIGQPPLTIQKPREPGQHA